MITALRLRNFQKHTDITLSFEEGTNLIVGPNWAGKSTILRGILFALFGVTAVPKGRATLESTRSGAGKLLVTMSFSLDGANYMIDRSLSTATLYKGTDSTSPETEATGTTAVNARMLELLGMSKSDFLDTQYAKQKETQNLLDIGANALSMMVERIRGVDLLAQAVPLVKTVRDTASGKASVLVHTDTEGMEQEAEVLAEGLAELARTAETLAPAIKQSSASLDLLSKQLTAAEKHQTALASSAAELKRASTQYETAIAEYMAEDKALQALPDYEDVADLEVMLAAAVSYQEVGVAITNYTMALGIAQEALEGLGEVTKGEVDTAVNAYNEAAVALRDAGRSRDLLKEEAVTGVCHSCHRPFEGHDPEALQKKIQAAESILAEAGKVFDKAGAAATDLQRRCDKYTRAKLDVDGITDELDSIRQKQTTVDFAADADPATLKLRIEDSHAARVAQAKARASVDATATASSNAYDIKVAAQARYDLLASQNAADTASLTSQAAGAHADLIRLTKQEAEVREQLTKMRGDVEANALQLKRSLEDNKTLTDAEAVVDVASRLMSFLKNNREAFMATVWDDTLAQASQFCSEATGGDIQQIDRRDGDFYYMEDGVWMLAISQASGAQASIAGLSVKVALATAVPSPLGCLLLDEVTADMRDDVSSTVTSLLNTTGRQVIAISHRDMDRGGDYNIIDIEEAIGAAM